MASTIDQDMHLKTGVLGMDNFWHLDAPSTRGSAWSDKAANDKLKALHGPMEPWFSMHRVPGVPVHVMLTEYGVKDIVWTWYSQCLIQDHVLRMFQEEGFTGFQVHPVAARWKRKPKVWTDIPVLWELIPVGWGGMAPEESGVHRVPLREGDERLCYSKFTDASRLIDRSQWDGSDFFIVWPFPGQIMVSERVSGLMKKEKLTGAKLVPSDKLVWPGGIGDTCLPGRLRLYLPEEKARRFGEPLGIY